MKWRHGDIWFWWKLGHIIVVPTNAGWTKDGKNVMGAGIALQASKLIPELPDVYGKRCMDLDPYFYYKEKHLVLLPTKPLDEDTPWLSWKQLSDTNTLIESLQWLQDNAKMFEASVYVPLLGAGNGGLDPVLVAKRMNEILTDPKFVGVLYE